MDVHRALEPETEVTLTAEGNQSGHNSVHADHLWWAQQASGDITPKLYIPTKQKAHSLTAPDVYCILCERGKVYVGQMGCATGHWNDAWWICEAHSTE
jgi:hypothetical protein